MHLSTAILATVHLSDCDSPLATPHPSLSSGCQLDRACVVGVCERKPARVCARMRACVDGWVGAEGGAALFLPQHPHIHCPRPCCLPLWLEVGMGASW